MSLNKTSLCSLLFLCFGYAEEQNPWTLKSYGEITYSNYNYSADPKKGPQGSIADKRATLDLSRLILNSSYQYDPTLSFSAEVEIEHGGTGGAMEIEYEEFGEYETEVEKGGEIVLEELYVTKKIHPALNLRAGRFIVRSGPLNVRHKPQQFLGTIRPEAEETILPTAWDETGIEVFGNISTDWNYHLQLVNGLDASGFGSKNWIREGHQSKFEEVNATDLATNIKIEYQGISHLNLGATAYIGNADNNRPKGDMTDDDRGFLFLTNPDLRIYSAYCDFSHPHYIARAMWIYGTLNNSKKISLRNRQLSTFSGQPRTNVAETALAWGFEFGYNVLQFTDFTDYKLFPFTRLEYANSMEETHSQILADQRYAKGILTFGMNLLLHSKIILKTDYSLRRLGLSSNPLELLSEFNNGKYNPENTFRMTLAFQTF